MVMLQLPYKKSARRLNRFPGWLQMVLPLPSIPLLLRITVPEKKTESMPDIGPLWKSYFRGVFSAPYFWYAFRLRFLRFSSQNLMLFRWESATWWSLVFLNYLAAWRLHLRCILWLWQDNAAFHYRNYFESASNPDALAMTATPLALSGIWWSISITSILKGLILFIWFQITIKKK